MADSGFLGRGWSFPTLVDQHRIASSSSEENISESIWIILSTAPGERVMRPTFGCGLHDLVFEVADAASLGRIKKTVTDALVLWEPRISVLDVDTEQKVDGQVLLINIHYQVRATNNFFNLVYPFYLTVGSAA